MGCEFFTPQGPGLQEEATFKESHEVSFRGFGWEVGTLGRWDAAAALGLRLGYR